MTDYEQFEAWWLTKFSAEFLDSDNCWSAWTGWQARGALDAVTIEILKNNNEALEADKEKLIQHTDLLNSDIVELTTKLAKEIGRAESRAITLNAIKGLDKWNLDGLNVK